MKIYFSIFKVYLLDGLQYKAAAISGVITQFVWGFLSISLFLVLNNGQMLNSQIATYFWLNQIFIALLEIWTLDASIFNQIENGDIQYQLLKPINIYMQWFVTGGAYRISRTILRSIPLIVFALSLPYPYRLQLPSNPSNSIFFLISLLLAFSIMLAIGNLMYILSIVFRTSLGIKIVFASFFDMFSGGNIPYVFFPKHIQIILGFSFFYSIKTVPYNYYLGNLNGVESLMIQLLWLIILIILGVILFKTVLKRIEVYGG